MEEEVEEEEECGEEDRQCDTSLQAGCSNFHRLELQEQCGGKVTNRTCKDKL